MKVQSVKWKSHGNVLNVPAEKVYEELNAIKDANDGKLRPNDVIAHAKDENSLIHSWFNWDDTAAAHKYRLMQAGSLIRSLEITYVELPKQPRRAYEVSIRKRTGDSTSHTEYATAEESALDPENHAKLIAEAVRTLMAWRRRFAYLQELAHFMEICDRTIEHFVHND
jgi:hypothetical protein